MKKTIMLALVLLMSAATLSWLSTSTQSQTTIRTNQIRAGTFSQNFTFSGTNTFSAQPVITPTTNQILVGASPNQTTLNFPAPSGNVTLAFPNIADTVVGRATTDTFTAVKTFNVQPVITGGLAVNQGGTGQTVASTFSSTAGGYSITVSCGTLAACSPSSTGFTGHIVFGSAPLVSGTPSTVTITAISPAFLSSASFNCVVTDATNAANNLLKVANVSSSSFTITGPNTLTDVINYICVGQ